MYSNRPRVAHATPPTVFHPAVVTSKGSMRTSSVGTGQHSVHTAVVEHQQSVVGLAFCGPSSAGDHYDWRFTYREESTFTQMDHTGHKDLSISGQAHLLVRTHGHICLKAFYSMVRRKVVMVRTDNMTAIRMEHTLLSTDGNNDLTLGNSPPHTLCGGTSLRGGQHLCRPKEIHQQVHKWELYPHVLRHYFLR